jgi:hypothetical protein
LKSIWRIALRYSLIKANPIKHIPALHTLKTLSLPHLEAVAKLSFGSVNFSDLVLTSCLVLPDRKQCLKNS